MKHKYNHLLAGYWAGVYSQAERVDLEDAVFSAITPNLFIAYSDSNEEPRFAATGSQVHKSLGHVIGKSYFSLFNNTDRSLVRKLLNLSRQRNEPLCFMASAGSDGEYEIEMSLFPIRQRDDQISCFMGLFLPLQDVPESGLSIPLRFVMSQEISDSFTSAGATIVTFRGKTA